MTKQFAVAFVDLSDNDLTIEFHVASDEFEAYAMHTEVIKNGMHIMPSEVAFIRDTDEKYEKLKEYFFDCDCLLDVKEVPQ